MSLNTEDLTLIYLKERRGANFSKSDLHPLPRSNPLVRPSSTRSTLRAKSALMLSERISLALLWQPSLSFLPCWHERDPQCHFRTRTTRTTTDGRTKGALKDSICIIERGSLWQPQSLPPFYRDDRSGRTGEKGDRRDCSKTAASIIGFSSRAQCQPSHVSLVLSGGIFVSSMGERNQTGGDDQYRKQRLGLRVKAFGRGGNTCTDKRRMKSGVRRTSSPTSILLLTVETGRKSSGEGDKRKMKEVTDRPEIGLPPPVLLDSISANLVEQRGLKR